MTNGKLHPDAPRIVLQRFVREAKKSGLTQEAIATAVGERSDSFSKTLNGAPSYALNSPLIIQVLNVIGRDFLDFAKAVEIESIKLYAG
ncbi:hypothetical protein SAMN05428970_1977 [Agromyces sp. CF514]|uniref:hypothetical protein n=1 Tax=Agromyces sp. CF514 TaxID=1881031 RepID=UPI0008DFD598|nr:hypothetical protein [Agromyces sp. CF514]SFR75835.1 hypothetical protein SAMN05428970_1977 [Agromyces sp. CF514]